MPDFGLSERTLTEIRRILSDCAAVEKAVLYGSRAMGTHKPGSDIDITLIGPELTRDMLAQLAGQFDDSSLPYQMDLSIRDEIDNPNLLDHIDRVGRVLYERSEC